MPYSPQTVMKGILAQEVKVTLTTDKRYAPVGDTVTFTARILVDGAPYPGQSLALYVFIEEVGGWYGIALMPETDADGYSRFTWTVEAKKDGYVLPCTDRLFAAAALGVSGETHFAIAYPTRLRITYAPDKILVCKNFPFRGVLEYQDVDGVWKGLAGRTVSLFYNETEIADLTTGNDGSWAKEDCHIPTSGTYTLSARYAGEKIPGVLAFGFIPAEWVPPDVVSIIQYAHVALATIPLLTVGGAIVYNELSKIR